MNPEILRSRFRDFVEDEGRFRKFIETCNRSARERGRLSFWQQELWDRFTRLVPEYATLDLTTVLNAFYVCHVHLVPLHRASIPIRKGLWCVDKAPNDDQGDPPPYSLQAALDSPAWGDSTHIDVDHCDECLAELRRRST